MWKQLDLFMDVIKNNPKDSTCYYNASIDWHLKINNTENKEATILLPLSYICSQLNHLKKQLISLK